MSSSSSDEGSDTETQQQILASLQKLQELEKTAKEKKKKRKEEQRRERELREQAKGKGNEHNNVSSTQLGGTPTPPTPRTTNRAVSASAEKSTAQSPTPNVASSKGIGNVDNRHDKAHSGSSIEPVDSGGEQQGKKKTTSYRDKGRTFCRIGNPYDSIEKIIEAGIDHDAAAELSDSEDEEGPRPNTHLSSTAPLLTLIMEPGFREAVRTMDKNERQAIAIQIKAGRDKVRADDTSGLKVVSLKYMRKAHDKSIGVKDESDKSLRGFNNQYTAKLIIPLEFGTDNLSETIMEIKKGNMLVTAKKTPAFLYPEGHIFNASNELLGYGYGHFAIRVTKHIYMGPGSALKGPGYHKGKSGNANICDMTSMTPESIAYAMIQARYMLSSQPEWSLRDNNFDVVTFYWEIVNVLRSSYSKHIIEFYNEQIWGDKKGSPESIAPKEDQQRHLSLHERLALQSSASKRPTDEELEAVAKRARLDAQGFIGGDKNKVGSGVEDEESDSDIGDDDGAARSSRNSKSRC
ncbi:hypothetical protein K474DRAFT_1680683 [Panus rudis PR-1116 ss-1]|nr:hypothetical protein K474DRAFT_1680683 [Panus rudis PR-1116 ss-1]